MTEKEFVLRRPSCEINQVWATIDQLEEQWLTALLLRMSIPKAILDKRRNNEMSNFDWRTYLLKTSGISISKHLGTRGVQVYKWDFAKEENLLVGEWESPEIIHKKEGNQTRAELRLRKWEIV